MATVLPSRPEKGGEANLVCKSNKPGELKDDVYSKQGKKLETLYTEQIQKNRTVVHTWNGKGVQTGKQYRGEYTIRWTIGDGYREFPVILK
jgi:hypothetical protein